MQEFSIPPDSWPGRAATKTAMEAAAKRASLENIVKMRVGWVFESSKSKDNAEVGYSN